MIKNKRVVQMYKLGTTAELEKLQDELETKLQPLVEIQKDIPHILQALRIGLTLLDKHYGEERNWEEEGGYAVLFTEPTQDDNPELLSLLEQYNQNPSCMELSRIITTVQTENGIVDWMSEIYLIGTEYGITVVRPRLRGMFDENTPRYLSRDVAEYIPMEIHAFLYRSIEKMRKQVDLDYLQVFELSVEITNGVVKMVHTQEAPECEQTTFWTICTTEGVFDNLEKWNGKKLYVIDDGIAITTLFPYER